MEKKVEHDALVSITIKPGRRFYEGKAHKTNSEIAEVLTQHANQYKGFVGELFLMVAKFHLQADEAVDAFAANATGEWSTSVGECGSCTVSGGKGYAFSVNGVLQKCFTCE